MNTVIRYHEGDRRTFFFFFKALFHSRSTQSSKPLSSCFCLFSSQNNSMGELIIRTRMRPATWAAPSGSPSLTVHQRKKKRNKEVKYRGTHGQLGFILLSCQQLARKQVLSLSLSKPHTLLLLLLHNSTNKHTTRALRADNPYATITLKEKKNKKKKERSTARLSSTDNNNNKGPFKGNE